MKHRIKHRITLIQDVEIPAGMDTEKLGEFLDHERQTMVQEITSQLRIASARPPEDADQLTHKLRKVAPSQGFELLL